MIKAWQISAPEETAGDICDSSRMKSSLFLNDNFVNNNIYFAHPSQVMKISIYLFI